MTNYEVERFKNLILSMYVDVYDDFDRYYNKALYDILGKIEEIAQSGWILVSERLPEDKELVLFSTKTDRVFEGRYFDDNTDRQWYSFRDDTFAWNNVVTAWMPLPEAYKEAENDVM